jgi:hypothetical protein
LTVPQHGFIGLDVHMDILKLADPVAFAVDEHLAAPVRDVADFNRSLPQSSSIYLLRLSHKCGNLCAEHNARRR